MAGSVLFAFCIGAVCCDETSPATSADEREGGNPILADTAIDLDNIEAGDIVFHVDAAFRSNPARFVFGLPSDARRTEELGFGPVHKIGVHRSVLESCPAIVRHLGLIGDRARPQRHQIALDENRRDGLLTDCTWRVRILSAVRDQEDWLLHVRATLGQECELNYRDTQSVEPELQLKEQWRLKPEGPVLVKRETQFSMQGHCAPYRRPPLTLAQLARDVEWARTQPTPPGHSESPLQRLQSACGRWLNDDLTVVRSGCARNADVDDELRALVMREASATWQRQIDQLKSCTIIIRREMSQWQREKTTSVSHYRVVHDLGNNSSLVETGAAPDFLIISNDNYWFSVTRPDGSQDKQKVTDARPRKSDAERSLFGSSMTPAIEPYLTFGKPLPDVLNDPQTYLWYRCGRNAEGLIEVVLHAAATGESWPMTLYFDPDRKSALLKWEHAKVLGDGDRGIVYQTSNVLDKNGLIVARRKQLERRGQPQQLIEDSFRITPFRSDPAMFRLSTYGCPEWPALWPDGMRPDYLQPDQIVDSSPL